MDLSNCQDQKYIAELTGTYAKPRKTNQSKQKANAFNKSDDQKHQSDIRTCDQATEHEKRENDKQKRTRKVRSEIHSPTEPVVQRRNIFDNTIMIKGMVRPPVSHKTFHTEYFIKRTEQVVAGANEKSDK
ncbi:hypothetical protein CBL_07237 [Carabus blaptoides fortunei]